MAKAALRVLSVSITILAIVLVIFGLYKFGGFCYEYGYRIYTEPAMTEGEGQDKLVQITPTTDLTDLAKQLEDKGLIRDWKIFYIQAKLSSFKVEQGIYTVNTSENGFELMKAMTPEESEEDDT